MYDTHIVRGNWELTPVSASFASAPLKTNTNINTTISISGGMHSMNREAMSMCMPSCMGC